MKKRNFQIVDLADNSLLLARELKKLWDMKVTVITIIIGALGTVTKGLTQGLENWKIKRMSRDHPNYSIIKNSQNPAENSGDMRRFSITQTPVRNHRLTLTRKT